MIKFYDTSSILLETDLFKENFIISSITLNELENIKTSANKDAETKLAARRLLQQLHDNPDKYTVCIYQPLLINVSIIRGW